MNGFEAVSDGISAEDSWEPAARHYRDIVPVAAVVEVVKSVFGMEPAQDDYALDA